MSDARLAAWLAALLLVDAPATAAGEWVRSTGGCLVWSADPKPGESVEWSGACVDGRAQGPGVERWLVDGRVAAEARGSLDRGFLRGTVDFKDPAWGVYAGEWYEDEACAGPQGIGTAKLKTGGRYEGRWRCGMRDGTGTMTYADGTKFEGGWRRDQAEGQGTLTRAAGGKIAVQCTAGRCKPLGAATGWARVP